MDDFLALVFVDWNFLIIPKLKINLIIFTRKNVWQFYEPSVLQVSYDVWLA